MTDLNKKLTHLLPDQIPDYVEEFFPLFTIFVTKYFEYLQNSSSGVQTTIQNLQLNRDIDTTASSLAIKFLNNFIPNFPSVSAVDDSILVKHFREFYQLKGSEKSFKFFFRAFFNDEIEIAYPRDYMFKTSAGKWYVEQSSKVIKNSGDPLSLNHTLVSGNSSRANAVVKDIINVVGVGENNYYDIIWDQGSYRAGNTRHCSNYLLRSSDLNVTPTWSYNNISLQRNVIAAPDGEKTVEKILESAATGLHDISQIFTVTPADDGVYTISTYVKPAERSIIALSLFDSSNTHGCRVEFNLTSETVLLRTTAGYAEHQTSTLERIGNDWYRCRTSIQIDTTSTQLNYILNLQATNNTTSYAGTAGRGLYIWGTQVEPGTVLQDYVATTGTARTNVVITGFQLGETLTAITYDYTESSIATTATVTMFSLGSIDTADGRYLNTQSQLSNDQLLQDSYYYQQFSYLLRTRNDREVWADHVLKQLHPTGTRLLNDFIADAEPTNLTTSFGRSIVAETTVRIPTINTYLSDENAYTFDRTGDLYTGTSTTLYATTTGFAVVTYTSIGNITYSPTYDYPGEFISFALQKPGDTGPTEYTRFDGPSWDKSTASIALDQQLIAWPRDVNSSLIVTRYAAVSSLLVAGDYVASFSSGVLTYNTPTLDYTTSVGSMIVLFNFAKNSQGNAPFESSNAIVVTFSSTASIIPWFGDETQRNLRRIALNDSLHLNNLIYTHSSNSITANLIADTTFSSYYYSTSTGQIIFKPAMADRGQAYDRLSLRFEIAPQTQLNTSLTETFNVQNITSTGLIASWSSTLTSVSVNSFINQTSNLMLWSEQFETGSAWTTSNATITSNVINSPTATLTADGLIETVANTRHEIIQVVATNIAPAGIYTYSIYAQPALRNRLRITSTDATDSTFCIFDLSSLSTTISGPVLNTTLTSVGGGWYRCSFTRAVSTTATSLTIYHHPYTTTSIYVGDATTSALYVWGSQLERKTVVNDYVQTTSAQITVNPQFVFSSNCFVFNGGPTADRFIQTPIFYNAGRVDMQLGYIVGDSYNGGEIPDAGEDLEIQYSLDAGSSWYTGHKLWVGSTSNAWVVGTTSMSGKIFVQAGSTRVTGFGTIFSTELVPGNRISITSGNTTAYTITSIVNNNELIVNTAFVDNVLNLSAALTGSVDISTSTATITGTATTFLADFAIGDRITVDLASTTTAYTVINVISDTEMVVAPTPVYNSSSLSYYKVQGTVGYERLPASDQFLTTSVSVYGPGPNADVLVRIKQISQSDLNNDVYAVENLNVQAYRYQDTTGVVNIGVAVSSNSTLNINDTDLFTITSIGTL